MNRNAMNRHALKQKLDVLTRRIQDIEKQIQFVRVMTEATRDARKKLYPEDFTQIEHSVMQLKPENQEAQLDPAVWFWMATMGEGNNILEPEVNIDSNTCAEDNNGGSSYFNYAEQNNYRLTINDDNVSNDYYFHEDPIHINQSIIDLTCPIPDICETEYSEESSPEQL